mgnify:CR=1 FL=1
MYAGFVPMTQADLDNPASRYSTSMHTPRLNMKEVKYTPEQLGYLLEQLDDKMEAIPFEKNSTLKEHVELGLKAVVELQRRYIWSMVPSPCKTYMCTAKDYEAQIQNKLALGQIVETVQGIVAKSDEKSALPEKKEEEKPTVMETEKKLKLSKDKLADRTIEDFCRKSGGRLIETYVKAIEGIDRLDKNQKLARDEEGTEEAKEVEFEANEVDDEEEEEVIEMFSDDGRDHTDGADIVDKPNDKRFDAYTDDLTVLYKAWKDGALSSEDFTYNAQHCMTYHFELN